MVRKRSGVRVPQRAWEEVRAAARDLRGVQSFQGQMKRLIASGVAAAALAAAAPAAADSPWSAPVDVGPPADYVYAPSLQFTAAGVGVALWLVRAQPAGAGGLPGAINVKAGADNDGISSRLAILGTAGGPELIVRANDTVAAGAGEDGSGRGVVHRTLVRGSNPNGYRKVRLGWSAVGRDGSIGALHPLASATVVTPPSLAVDARGDALAAWVEYQEPRRRQDLYGTNVVVAAWRPAGKTFSRRVVLRRTQYLDFEHGGTVHVAM